MTTKHTKAVGIFTLLLFFGSILVLGGLFYILESAKERLSERQHAVAEAHMHENELAALVRLVEGSIEEREQLNTYMLYEEDVIDFLALLERSANEQGVALEIRSISVADARSAFEELEIDVQAQGTYPAVLHTLRLFENLPHQAHVSSVSLSKAGEAGEAWTGAFTLRVIKYQEES